MPWRHMAEWMYRSTFFLKSALIGGEWSASRSGRFTPEEKAAGTHWIGGWLDPRTGMEDMEKRKFLPLPRPELQTRGRPVCSQSLYWLSYPGFQDCSCSRQKVVEGSRKHGIVYVRFKVFTAVPMKNAVFWDVAPCRSCVNRRFGGTSVHTTFTRRHIPEDGILRNNV
jgi:hypothetical protein